MQPYQNQRRQDPPMWPRQQLQQQQPPFVSACPDLPIAPPRVWTQRRLGQMTQSGVHIPQDHPHRSSDGNTLQYFPNAAAPLGD